MKKTLIISCVILSYLTSIAQDKIELKNKTIISEIRIHSIKQSVVEYEKNKSLHDVLIDNISAIYINYGDTMIVFDSINKPHYFKKKNENKVIEENCFTQNNSSLNTEKIKQQDLVTETIYPVEEAITINFSNIINRIKTPVLIGYEKRLSTQNSVLLEAGPTCGILFKDSYSEKEISGINARVEVFKFSKKSKYKSEVNYTSFQLVFANNFYNSDFSTGFHFKKGVKHMNKNSYLDFYIGAGIRYHNTDFLDNFIIPSATIGFRIAAITKKH
ncbi:MAG: hypothetical protein V4667_06305 [Bacteroidota bacterium]